ncbi:uncharacterized protein LOC113361992 [Papaver somniferum]|uniref:uncharacterized protein LOC113361992 n=1 Tax=Papaver somniferum TaxID=3469 RepID=UPI000E6FFE70|nr:uncharacterized protein LOC113361992 [Papaver somniferum]
MVVISLTGFQIKSMIAFWNDIWKGNYPLSISFPSLYKLSMNRDAKMVDMISTDGSWMFNFKRNLVSAEVNSLAELLVLIGSNPPALDELPDTRRWTLNSSDIFTVKSLYSNLTSDFGIPDFPHNFVWNSSIPPKINFLVWCLIHDKLNTLDVMQIKGIDIYNSCVLCGDDTESQEHIFLHCKIAHRVWSSVLPKEGWSWAIPRNMQMLALGWNQVHFTTAGKFLWDLIPAAVIYTIWSERNRRIFEMNYNFKTDSDLCIEAKSLILAWASASGQRIQNFSSTIFNNWDALFM